MDSLHKGRKKHMKNELFSIGPFTVYGYGLMIGIGIIAAYLTAESRAKKLKLDPEKIFGLVLWCLIFGYLGSKIPVSYTHLDVYKRQGILRTGIILPVRFGCWMRSWYSFALQWGLGWSLPFITG